LVASQIKEQILLHHGADLLIVFAIPYQAHFRRRCEKVGGSFFTRIPGKIQVAESGNKGCQGRGIEFF
jgi:hypothetical protein